MHRPFPIMTAEEEYEYENMKVSPRDSIILVKISYAVVKIFTQTPIGIDMKGSVG